MSNWIDKIEETEIDKYIETHFAVMKENLDNVQMYFKYAVRNAKIIEKLLNRKNSI